MATGFLLNLPKFQAFDSNGDPLSGGLVYTYAAGTSTAKTAYSDRTCSTPLTNPVVLDSNGEATIYLDGYYKVVLKSSAGATLWTMDNLVGIGYSALTGALIVDYGLDLAVAVAAIGSAETTLYIDQAVNSVSANLTIPSNICLECKRGADIPAGAGVTITYNCQISAGPWQIFSGAGTHTVNTYPQDQAWWGNTARFDPNNSRILTASIFGLWNVGLAASVAAKALTVSLKGADGNAPSVTNPVEIGFRNATLTTGSLVTRKVTSALTVTLSSGSTLGFTSALAGRIYVWAIDNAGTIELALSRTADIFPEGNVVTTTAEGGAGGADSAAVMYSTTGRTGVAYRCIGYIEITTGATAGEWDNSPTKIQVMGPGVKRTGDIVQTQHNSIATLVTCATVIPYDDTVPQKTEGDEVLTQAITPTSAINKLDILAESNLGNSGANAMAMCIFQDDTAGALATQQAWGVATSAHFLRLHHRMTAGTASATTFKMRCGGSGGTTYVNSNTGAAALYGGTLKTTLTINEIFA